MFWIAYGLIGYKDRLRNEPNMMRRMMFNIVMAFLLIWAPLVFSGPGPLFNIVANGESSGNINMTLCLNGNGPLSCQNYTVNNLNLNIKTTIPNNIITIPA